MPEQPTPAATRAEGAELEVYRPGELTVPEVRELTGDLVNTEFVPKALRGKPGAVLACILTGQELGIGPMASLGKVHVIEGRPALSAELMRAIVIKAGHALWLEESSATRVTLAGHRRETPEHVTKITWTMDDAKRAGVDTKQNWRNYPRAMLTARATGELCRMVFPDVLAGISYTREEVADGFTFDEDAPSDGDLAPDDVAAPAEGGEGRPGRPQRRTAPDAGRSRAEAAAPPPAASAPLEGEDEDDVEDAVIVGEGGEVIDVEAAEVAPEPVPEEGDPGERRGATPAQALVLASKDAGLTDEDRHGVYAAITAGRTTHGNELERDELTRAREVFGLIKDGVLVLTKNPDAAGAVEWIIAQADDLEEWVHYGAIPAPAEPDPEPDVAPNPEPEPEAPAQDDGPDLSTEDGWRTFIKDKGIRLPDVLRTAKALAGDGTPPTSLGALAADADLGAKVAEHFERAT